MIFYLRKLYLTALLVSTSSSAQSLQEALNTASGLIATTYGYGELMCGEVGSPRPCNNNAVTFTGMKFEPNAPSVAIFAPKKLRFPSTFIRIRVEDGPCGWVVLNDKGNARFFKKRGFDLTPGALLLLGIKPSPYWKGVVHVCN